MRERGGGLFRNLGCCGAGKTWSLLFRFRRLGLGGARLAAGDASGSGRCRSLSICKLSKWVTLTRVSQFSRRPGGVLC